MRQLSLWDRVADTALRAIPTDTASRGVDCTLHFAAEPPFDKRPLSLRFHPCPLPITHLPISHLATHLLRAIEPPSCVNVWSEWGF